MAPKYTIDPPIATRIQFNISFSNVKMQLAVSYSLNMFHRLLTGSEEQMQQRFFHWICSLCKNSIMNMRLYPAMFILLHTHLSIQLSSSVVCKFLWLHGLQHSKLLCSSLTPRTCSHSCPLSRSGHPTISSSFVPFSSCLQSFPASGSFLRNQFFTSGGQSIAVSASASVLPMNIQDWFPLGCTGWISLQSKGLSRVFSNTIVQKHQFFGTQLSLWSKFHIHTLLLEKL